MLKHNIIFNLFGVLDDFSFSTKGSIEIISVGMERSNGIPMEIFRLHHWYKCYQPKGGLPGCFGCLHGPWRNDPESY